MNINRLNNIIKNSAFYGEDIVIRSATSREMVDESIKNGKKSGFERAKTSDIIATFLGEIAGFVLRDISINGIFITGGDTAIKTIQNLNVSGTIIEDEILPGIPYGHFIDDRFRDITVVTKAGGFGEDDTIIKVLDFLKNR